MGTNLRTEYKNYVIEWIDWEAGFSIIQNDARLKGKVRTIKECQEWIDKKEKEKFNRMPAYLLAYDRIKKVEITSVIDEDHVWVTDKNKQRSKENIDYLLKDIPQNEQIINLIEDIELKMINLTKERVELKVTLERLPKEDLIKQIEA